jgi:hypothetical protein
VAVVQVTAERERADPGLPPHRRGKAEVPPVWLNRAIAIGARQTAPFMRIEHQASPLLAFGAIAPTMPTRWRKGKGLEVLEASPREKPIYRISPQPRPHRCWNSPAPTSTRSAASPRRCCRAIAAKLRDPAGGGCGALCGNAPVPIECPSAFMINRGI